MSWRNRWQAINNGLQEFYQAPYRRTLVRAHREETDLFMLLIFAESLGIPNTMTWYTFELQPLLMEEFHHWHQRQGMAHSPFDHIGCC